MRYFVPILLYLLIAGSVARAEPKPTKDGLSIYAGKDRVIAIDLARKVVASGKSREQAESFVELAAKIGADQRVPTNIHDISEAGACGIQVDELVFIIPAKRETLRNWTNWTFVSAKSDIAPAENFVVGVERKRGMMTRFSYDSTKGVSKFLLYDFPEARTSDEFILVQGPGLLADCLRKEE